MTEQQSGLRFDIYERVQLADSRSGIRELDEIELVPHIRVNVEDDHAVLKGNLWLTGKYAGEDDSTPQTLEHLIPVEITMPLSRIEKLENVAVDIENFDVDLLSARSLNVTGVLSLRGIEMRADELEAPQSLPEEEEVVFVHQAEPTAVSTEAAERIFPEEVGLPGTEGAMVQSDDPAIEEAIEADAPVSGPAEEAEAGEQPDEAVAAAVVAAPEKTETKLVFGSKPADTEAAAAGYSLKKLLALQKEYRSAEAGESPQEAGASANRQNSIEWQKLFLTRTESVADKPQFRRMRVCIVQKEETLESIAQRYKINPREIVLYNRLAEQQVVEGQVLYIP